MPVTEGSVDGAAGSRLAGEVVGMDVGVADSKVALDVVGAVELAASPVGEGVEPVEPVADQVWGVAVRALTIVNCAELAVEVRLVVSWSVKWQKMSCATWAMSRETDWDPVGATTKAAPAPIVSLAILFCLSGIHT